MKPKEQSRLKTVLWRYFWGLAIALCVIFVLLYILFPEEWKSISAIFFGVGGAVVLVFTVLNQGAEFFGSLRKSPSNEKPSLGDFIKLAEKTDKPELARALNVLGELYSQDDLTEEEAEQLQEAFFAAKQKDLMVAERLYKAVYDRRRKQAKVHNTIVAKAARGLAAVAAANDAARAFGYWREATQLDPQHFWGWIDLSRSAQTNGKLAEGRRAAEQALDLRRDGGSLAELRDRMVALGELGEISTAEGKLPQARESYEKVLAISKRLAASDPKNAERQRDLSVSHDKMGNLWQAEGNLEAARASYEASLEISERLSASDPKNAEWQRDLSASHSRIGNLWQADGNLKEARASYEAALEISERLATSDPKNAAWQRDLSVSHNKIGDLWQAEGNLEAARRSYEAALKIREGLAASDPKNAEWQRDLSVSYEKIGDLWQAEGNLEEARRSYEAALKIREGLAASDPKNAEWQRDLSVSYEKIGELWQAEGNLEEARRSYEAAFEIRKHLAASDSKNAEWQTDLSVSHYRLGQVSKEANSTAARVHLETALEILQRLDAEGRLEPAKRGWIRIIEAELEGLDGL